MEVKKLCGGYSVHIMDYVVYTMDYMVYTKY